jgi:hypothetical protein
MAEIRFEVEVSVKLTGLADGVPLVGSETVTVPKQASHGQTASAVRKATHRALEAGLKQMVDQQRKDRPIAQPA